MRATGRLCALLCALLAVLPAVAARADITPLPKPAGVSPKPAAGHSGSLIAPLSRPAVRTTVKPARPHATSARRTTLHPAARAARRHAFVPVTSRGGRERVWRVISSGGRETPATAPPAAASPAAGLMPTPLGFAASDESPPLASPASPPWKISVLTLLAGAEAFLLVRLARSRRPARTSGI